MEGEYDIPISSNAGTFQGVARELKVFTRTPKFQKLKYMNLVVTQNFSSFYKWML